MSSKSSRNPCTGKCRFDADGACRGCHRTKAEVKGWKRLPDTTKAAINQRIRQHTQTQAASTKPRNKRLRKLDKKIGKLTAKLAALRAERAVLTGAPAAAAGA